MIEEYKKTKQQVILSSTLKDEEYNSGSKYHSIPGVTAINYESNPNSHILQACIIYITNRELSEWPQVAEDKHLMETLTQKLTSGSQLIRL